jgi:hypothetical protein
VRRELIASAWWTLLILILLVAFFSYIHTVYPPGRTEVGWWQPLGGTF